MQFEFRPRRLQREISSWLRPAQRDARMPGQLRQKVRRTVAYRASPSHGVSPPLRSFRVCQAKQRPAVAEGERNIHRQCVQWSASLAPFALPHRASLYPCPSASARLGGRMTQSSSASPDGDRDNARMALRIGTAVGAFSAAPTLAQWLRRTAFQKMQPDGDRMGANQAALARDAAGAKIIRIGRAANNQPGAISGGPFLDRAVQFRRLPIGSQHAPRRHQPTRLFDSLPPRQPGQQRVGQFDIASAHVTAQ